MRSVRGALWVRRVNNLRVSTFCGGKGSVFTVRPDVAGDGARRHPQRCWVGPSPSTAPDGSRPPFQHIPLALDVSPRKPDLGPLCASLRVTGLDTGGELSERPRASASTTEVRKAMSVLFAFAPFLTFVLLGIHLYQVGEVTQEHDHGSHH